MRLQHSVVTLCTHDRQKGGFVCDSLL
ncbi:hypothetical protein BO443_120094 [Burkholderia orbicola]